MNSPGDGLVQRLQERHVNPLTDEPVEVDRAAEQLDVSLPQQGHVAVRRRGGDVRAQV